MSDEFYGLNNNNGGTDNEDINEYDSCHEYDEEDALLGSNKGKGRDVDLAKYRGESTTAAVNPTSVKERIDETLEILKNFKGRTNSKISRSDLLDSLSRDIAEYYGYIPELSTFLLNLFSPSECLEYMESSDRPRPLVIRTNTLKTTRKDLMDALTKRGANVEPVEWSKVAIKVTESTVPIGATPEYLGGHYMLQSAASMNPVLALGPLPNERILDMAAAPGGKTSYIAQLMKNSGIIVANDLKAIRQKATVANLHRLGVKTALVCHYDGRTIPRIMKGFDRVLLDAPCSGLGVIARDPSVKVTRTVKDIERIAHLQKELLLSAIDAVDCCSVTGGVVVYSTCSIAVEENEAVVNYALNKRYVRLVDTGLAVGKPGFTRFQQKRFPSSMGLTRRFYPHVHNMDGFFVSKLQKYKDGPRESDDLPSDCEDEEVEDVEDEESVDIIKQEAPLSQQLSKGSKGISPQSEVDGRPKKSSKKREKLDSEVAAAGAAAQSKEVGETPSHTGKKKGGKVSTAEVGITASSVSPSPSKKVENAHKSPMKKSQKEIDEMMSDSTNRDNDVKVVMNMEVTDIDLNLDESPEDYVDPDIEFNFKGNKRVRPLSAKKGTKRVSIKDLRKHGGVFRK